MVLTGWVMGCSRMELWEFIRALRTSFIPLYISCRTTVSHGLGRNGQHMRQLNGTSSGMYTTTWYISSVTTHTRTSQTTDTSWWLVNWLVHLPFMGCHTQRIQQKKGYSCRGTPGSGWLDSLVVRALDLWLHGREFNSRPLWWSSSGGQTTSAFHQPPRPTQPPTLSGKGNE